MYLQRGISTLTLLLVLRHAFVLSAQPATPEVQLRLHKLASLPKSLKEASGLEMTSPGILWTHNDDRMPVLYALDTAGNVLHTIHLNHKNKGWESLAADDNGDLYIGAFGNNNNDRRDLSILKVRNPRQRSETVVNAEVIDFSYEDQTAFPPDEAFWNFDCDALVSDGDSLYLITKNRTHPFTGYAKVYRLPSDPGKHVAVLHDSLYLGSGNMMSSWVTGADLSHDEKTLVLLSHDCIWIVSNYRGRQFSSGTIVRIPLGHLTHKAGICFGIDNSLYIVDEVEFGVLGGNLYRIDLDNISLSQEGQ